MNFTDRQLQKCYDSNFESMPELCGEQRQIGALIAAHDLFQMLEGPHSSRVHETIEQLLWPALRPELRHWYQRPAACPDAETTALRDHLSQLAGEKLELTDIPHNPS